MTQTADDLVLYHFNSCPFCIRVRYAADRLGVDLKLADISRQPEHRQELAEAMNGRTTVPVLRIENGEGVQWMPESADIVRYLKERFS